MRAINALFPSLAVVLALPVMAPHTNAAPATPTARHIATLDQSLLVAGHTPLQDAITRAIAERKAQGLPVPSATFEVTDDAVLAPTGKSPLTPVQGRQITVVARTTIHYDGPEQAGRAAWPDFGIPSSLPPGADGFVIPGDYSSLIRDRLAERVPGIWDRYTFGHEPRTCVYTERITITFAPEGTPGPAPMGDASQTNELLMGFTIIGPNLVYQLGQTLEIAGVDVASFTVKFGFDYGVGLRLPMQVGMTLAESMLEGSTYTGATTASGLNWQSGHYAQVGVPEEQGNEFVLRLFLGATIDIDVFDHDVFKYTVGVDEDHSSSFAAPFGPGATFDLPTVNIPVWGYDFGVGSVEIGLQLTPQLGSDRFEAQWQVSDEGQGGGSLLYSNPANALSLGPITGVDGPGYATIKLDDFKYCFTNFTLEVGLYLGLSVLSGEWTFPFALPGIDLSSITDDLYLGTHSGTPGAIESAIAIQNVAPTAAIDRGAATLIQGVPTFVTERLAPQTFTGTARDPGRDDLTLTWDWGDGLPTPDVSTSYPVPHEVTENQTHAFGSACLFDVALQAADDDGAKGGDHAPVLVLSEVPHVARLDGYWLHQLGQNGATDFSADQLQCILGVVRHCSKVFSETRDISTLQGAFDVLFLGAPGTRGEEQTDDVIGVGGGGRSGREQLDRELLVTWLNFAQGTFGYFEGLDTDADGIGDMAFAAVLDGIETTRLDPDATEGALHRAIGSLHALNVGRVGSVAWGPAITRQDVIAKGTHTAAAGSAIEGSANDVQERGKEIEGLRCASTAAGTMEISFSVVAGAMVRLDIFDVSGRRVRSFDGTHGSGTQRILWDGASESGRPMASGVYIVVLEKQGVVSRAKGILLR